MTTFLQNQQTTLRFGLIGVIVLAMLIPLAMVEGVTDERQAFFDMTMADIANAWGNAQSVSGPFLIVPEVHRYQMKNEADQLVWQERRRDRVGWTSARRREGARGGRGARQAPLEQGRLATTPRSDDGGKRSA